MFGPRGSAGCCPLRASTAIWPGPWPARLQTRVRWVALATLAYVEKVRTQFLSLRQLRRRRRIRVKIKGEKRWT